MKNYTDVLAFRNEDIIITDPCYMLTDEDKAKADDYQSTHGAFDNSIEKDFGAVETAALKTLGFNKVIAANTIIGDWSCKVYKKLKGGKMRKIGTFCADAGEVVVAALKEIAEHNPNFDYKSCEQFGCAAIIKNFTGNVYIVNNDRTVQIIGDGTFKFYSIPTGELTRIYFGDIIQTSFFKALFFNKHFNFQEVSHYVR